MDKFYITTAIPYVNAVPHVGHALEFIQADTIARFMRSKGRPVRFQLGVDEHGIKLFQTATEAGEEPKAFADKNAEVFRQLVAALNISSDFFIRTTDEFHKRAAQELWKACAKDIYKDTFEGLYCVGCEEYKTDGQLQNGKCPLHPNLVPEKLKEENYFFRLSRYSAEIAKKIKSDELKIYPSSRKNEILNLIESGLHDVPVSRLKEKLPWGIEVPGDPQHVMYVWFDALPNYITGVGYGDDKRADEFKQWWPADLHVIGKDILRFHAALWPGMLLSAGVELPKAILVHGFVTGEGKKMSKSLGNVVEPFGFIKKFGVDALRYYLLREIPSTEDGDFSMKRFIERYNYDLANDLGNLVQRVSSMCEKYLKGELPPKKNTPRQIENYDELMLEYRLNESLEKIWEMVNKANAYIEETKPWQVAKTDDGKIGPLLGEYINQILDIAWFLEPFMPDTAVKIEGTFSGDKLKAIPALFPKIEDAV